MIKWVYVIVIVVFITGITSCRNDFEFTESKGNLEFSQDTVYLDTVFSTIGSSTRTFKVYNRSDEDIFIPQVTLGKGLDSRYRISIDGLPGQEFENVEILAQDSIYVFVETNINISDFTEDDDFLYEDEIQFDTGADQQNIPLITLVRDAIFLFPERDSQGMEESLLIGLDDQDQEIRISGFLLEDNELDFTSDKPYVIYGFAAIPSNKILSIEAGSRIYFHSGSGIIAANNASLQINGSASSTIAMENEVILQGDRLEASFENVTGQWFGIWLTDGSKNHELSYTTIKNASIGIIMDNFNPSSNGPTLQLKNSKIYNSSNVGLLATTASISAENCIFHNAGQSSLVARLGGAYDFNNCTISNYWDKGFRQDPAMIVSNTFPNTDLTAPLTQFDFTNGIIYGDRERELLLNNSDSATFNFQIANTLLKFEDVQGNFTDNPLYDFSNGNRYTQIVLNGNPRFENVDRNLLRIDNESAANGIANSNTATPNDITGSNRGPAPDAGAFESIELEMD